MTGLPQKLCSRLFVELKSPNSKLERNERYGHHGNGLQNQTIEVSIFSFNSQEDHA